MLPQDTDWFRDCVAAEPHQYDTCYSTREKLERREEFDRWLAEVKAERDKHIISLIKKDCEHAKFGDPCFHDYIIDEIEAQLNRQGEEQ